MSRLSYRRNQRDSYNSGAYKVVALEVGAQASAGGTSQTINVYKGHGFAAGDKLIVNTDATNKYREVKSVAEDTITLKDLTTVTVAKDDLLVNLGPDTGTTSPNYDGSPIRIHADMDGSQTPISNATVSIATDGIWRYWSYNRRIWEIVIDPIVTVDPYEILPDMSPADSEVVRSQDARSFGAVADGTADDTQALKDAIDAADQVSGGRVLLPGGNYKLTSNVTVPTGVTLDFRSDAKLTIPTAGNKLTINGDVVGGRTKIFDAAVDDVEFTEQVTVFPEWWGASDTATDNEVPFDKAIKALKNGGTVLGGGPGSTYEISDDVTITKSDITLDFQGALLKCTSNKRFIFDGDSTTAGDWSSAVQNSHFRNARIGDADSNRMLGPMLTWCEDCSVQNVVKRGDTNTAFNMRICRRCTFRDVWDYGSNTNGGFFGFLLHIVWDCVVENCHLRDGPFGFGFQVKGGRNNRVLNCSIENQINEIPEQTTPVEEGFKDRGDAPWGVSGTTGITYPWTTGSWGTADDRRASHNTVFLNCSVEASPDVNAFTAQESIGTVFQNVFWNDVKTGVSVHRVTAGKERDFVIQNARGQKAGTTGNYSSAGIGIICTGKAGNPLPGTQVLGGHVDECEAHGLLAEDCDDLLIDGLEVKNSDQGGTNKDGVRVEDTCFRPRLVNVLAYDDQTTATQTIGINVATTCTRPIIQGCTGWGNTAEQIRSFLPGYYEGNSPGEATAQTTSAVNLKNRLQFNLETGTTVWIEVMATAKEGTTNRGLWWIGGLFGVDGAGNAVQSGATQTISGPINDWAGAEGITLNVIAATKRVEVWIRGKASTTIDWVLRARCVIVG